MDQRSIIARVWLSVAAYLAFAVTAAGAVSLIYPLHILGIHTRIAGLLIAMAGLAVAAAALAWPAETKRAAGAGSLLDESIPAWQFDERHTIRIDAPPDRVYMAMRQVTAREIRLFRTLTAIRRFGRAGPEGILNAPDRQPLIDVATSTTFGLLAESPPREIVIGTVVLAPQDPGRVTAELFRRELEPGVALAAMNFIVSPDGRGGSILSTETRVYANSPTAIRRFAVYWRVIHPGSDLIRRMWLRAVKRRAEGQTVDGRR